jgi:ATP-dependent DNA ligase
VKSVLLDGEGIVYDPTGMPSFDLIHSKQYDREASLIALLELDGEDVRKADLLARKLRLKVLVGRLRAGIEYNDHIEGAVLRYLQPPVASVTKAWWPSGKTCRMRAAGRSAG